jgi:hypothetical protein
LFGALCPRTSPTASRATGRPRRVAASALASSCCERHPLSTIPPPPTHQLRRSFVGSDGADASCDSIQLEAQPPEALQRLTDALRGIAELADDAGLWWTPTPDAYIVAVAGGAFLSSSWTGWASLGRDTMQRLAELALKAPQSVCLRSVLHVDCAWGEVRQHAATRSTSTRTTSCHVHNTSRPAPLHIPWLMRRVQSPCACPRTHNAQTRHGVFIAHSMGGVVDPRVRVELRRGWATCPRVQRGAPAVVGALEALRAVHGRPDGFVRATAEASAALTRLPKVRASPHLEQMGDGSAIGQRETGKRWADEAGGGGRSEETALVRSERTRGASGSGAD